MRHGEREFPLRPRVWRVSDWRRAARSSLALSVTVISTMLPIACACTRRTRSPLTSSWLRFRILFSGLGGPEPLPSSLSGGGLLIAIFSFAKEFKLLFALWPGVGEPGFAPLSVGIWLCGPSEDLMSRVAGGKAPFGPPFLLDLNRNDIVAMAAVDGPVPGNYFLARYWKAPSGAERG